MVWARRHILLRCNFQRRNTRNHARHVRAAGIKEHGQNCMGAKVSSLSLVKSISRKMVRRPALRTNEIVPQSGIYRVRHKKHRLPHEVTLLEDQRFPRCAKCHNAVKFEMVRGVTFTQESLRQFPQIRLYELPDLEDEQEIAA